MLAARWNTRNSVHAVRPLHPALERERECMKQPPKESIFTHFKVLHISNFYIKYRPTAARGLTLLATPGVVYIYNLHLQFTSASHKFSV